MERLRALRQGFKLTQGQVAERLGTTQQTVARWESGKTEPGIAALKDLAVLYGTSVDDLLGHNPMVGNSQALVTNHYLPSNDHAFWGHVGLQLPGEQRSRWYPITWVEANRIMLHMANPTADTAWVTVETLNNRWLAFDLHAMKRIALLDDDASQPEDDWELGWDSYQGHPMEIYRALAEWFYLEDPPDCSDAFRQRVEDIIADDNLTEEDVVRYVLDTIVHFKDGTSRQLATDDDALGMLAALLPMAAPPVLDLSARQNGAYHFVPADTVRLLDVPLHRIVDANKRVDLEFREIEADDLARRAVIKAQRAPRRSGQTPEDDLPDPDWM
jgi:transcriptional regulator with XRE-family HTH domain